MLFQIGLFWKTLILLVLSWSSYAFFGFEFTAITLLSLIFVFTIKKDTYLL